MLALSSPLRYFMCYGGADMQKGSKALDEFVKKVLKRTGLIRWQKKRIEKEIRKKKS